MDDQGRPNHLRATANRRRAASWHPSSSSTSQAGTACTRRRPTEQRLLISRVCRQAAPAQQAGQAQLRSEKRPDEDINTQAKLPTRSNRPSATTSSSIRQQTVRVSVHCSRYDYRQSGSRALAYGTSLRGQVRLGDHRRRGSISRRSERRHRRPTSTYRHHRTDPDSPLTCRGRARMPTTTSMRSMSKASRQLYEQDQLATDFPGMGWRCIALRAECSTDRLNNTFERTR